MKLDFIKEKKEFASVALCGISVVLTVLIFVKIASYFRLSASAQDIVQTIKARDNTKRGDPNKYLTPIKEMADNLKKSNLFAPPPEKRNPITEVRSILGNEAFINGSWYKQGAVVQDAKIVSIEPAQVTIEWNGQTTVYKPMDAAMASAGPGERPPSGPSSGSPSRAGISSTAGPSGSSRGMAAPPPQEQPPPEVINMPTSGPVMIAPSSQEQIPEQVQKQMMEAMEKARSMSEQRMGR
jgi:hypothetical protein